MTQHLIRYVLPAAFALLPARMASTEATALLVAIALQESDVSERFQRGGGPARGFYQFERGGIHGVLTHPASQPWILPAIATLRYRPDVETCHGAVAHNDTLATAFARCLLWTLPDRLPGPSQVDMAWHQYLRAWRPGKPRPEYWPANYAAAWSLTDAG